MGTQDKYVDPFDVGPKFLYGIDTGSVSAYAIGTDPIDPIPSPREPILPYIPAPGSTPEFERFTTREIHDKRLDFIKRLLDRGMSVCDACLLYTNCGKDIDVAVTVYHLAILCETDPVKLANNSSGLRGSIEYIIKACNREA